MSSTSYKPFFFFHVHLRSLLSKSQVTTQHLLAGSACATAQVPQALTEQPVQHTVMEVQMLAEHSCQPKLPLDLTLATADASQNLLSPSCCMVGELKPALCRLLQ